LDLLKGALPTATAVFLQRWSADGPRAAEFLYMPELIGLAAILGHLFPVYLNLHGGKGVATAVGVLLMLAPVPLAAAVVVFGLTLLVTRIVSVASVAAAAGFLLCFFLSHHAPLDRPYWALTAMATATALLVWGRHWSNMIRVAQGTEPTVRFRRPPTAPPNLPPNLTPEAPTAGDAA
ncbi:MAG: glycerol-3-phosphate acyltransferase, partial [Planctomycetia bacterium]